MLFKVKIDATFEANDIDDAMVKLGTYLTYWTGAVDAPTIFNPGAEVLIEPINMKD